MEIICFVNHVKQKKKQMNFYLLNSKLLMETIHFLIKKQIK